MKNWIKRFVKRPQEGPGVHGTGCSGPVEYGVTTSLNRDLIDEVMKMPDIASAALTKLLNDAGLNAGISTGLNFLVTLYKAYQL
ncbi:hypothetical protein TELCIR_23029, partial [Teladorsagia circumcincta]